MKQIFFKTVNEDYTSVWPIGRFKKKYKVGKRYVFPEEHPAFIYGLHNGSLIIFAQNHSDSFPEQSLLDHDIIYKARAERSGNRVLICYGEVASKCVKMCKVEKDWDFSTANTLPRWTSSYFIVIGEIEPKQRDVDISKELKKWKVKGASK